MDQLERALAELLAREGVDVPPSRQRGRLVVDFRIVLHRAGAEGVELRVYREILLREAGEMPHQAELVQLGQVEAVAGESLGDGRRRHVAVGQGGAPASRRRDLEKEGLFPEVHAEASSRDLASSSICPLVHISVTQTRSSCLRSGK